MMFNWLRALVRNSPVPMPRWNFASVLELIGVGDVQTRMLTTKHEQLRAYQGWCYAAASIIASDIRSNPWRIYQRTMVDGAEEWEEIPDDSVPMIFTRPNARQTWAEFAELSSLHLDLTGETFWNIITAGGEPGGKAVGIEALVPSWINEPLFDDSGIQLLGWRVNVPGQAPRVLDARDVVFTRYPSPVDPFRGASPVEAFALSQEMDVYSRGYAVALMKNRAQPDGLISSEQELTKDQADAIRARWRELHSNPGEIAVLGKGSKYQQTAVNIKDLEFSAFSALSRDQILAIYRVPASKLGLTTDVNRSNSDAADATYKENAILPRLRRFEEAINTYLMPRILTPAQARTMYFEFDSPVDEDREFALRQNDQMFTRGVITVNEYRSSQGLDPIDESEEYGESYYMPMSVNPTLNPLEMSLGASSSEDDPEDDEEDAPPAPTPPPPGGASVTRLAVSRQLVEQRFLSAQGRLEAAMKSTLRKRFSIEQKIVVGAYLQDARSGSRGAAVGDDVVVPLVRGWVEDALARTRKDWNDDVRKFIQRGIREGWLLAKEELDKSLDFSIYEEEAVQFAATAAGEKVVEIQEHTRDSVKSIVSKGIEDGSSVDDIAANLRRAYDGFKGYRAERIARTETASSMNYGKIEHAREVDAEFDLTTRKVWLTTRDDRTRPTHADADGQRVGLDEAFRVGDDELDHPGDPSGSPGEIINCRCTMILESE